MEQYWQWVAAHQPTDPRGQCVAVTERMAEAFPELRRVRGHYICPLEGRRPHWWMETADGRVIDPTVEQFASNGAGDYEEYTGAEPTGHCLNCGALLFNETGFCDTACATETAAFLARGGTVYVNGQPIEPSVPDRAVEDEGVTR